MEKKQIIKKLANQFRDLLSSSVDNFSSYDNRDFECEQTAKMIIEIIKKTIKEEK